MPWWAMTGVMVSVGLVSIWFLRVGSRMIPLSGPAALRPNSDSPFQLSLAAELTHHFPPQVPYVAGEPLTYHWMVYNHIASAHQLARLADLRFQSGTVRVYQLYPPSSQPADRP
jgi:hypothetical protein